MYMVYIFGIIIRFEAAKKFQSRLSRGDIVAAGLIVTEEQHVRPTLNRIHSYKLEPY